MGDAPIDLRGLTPPEPLFRVLDVLETGGDGPFVFLLSREPLPLYALLAREGFGHTTRRDDSGVEVTVYRQTRKP